MSVTDPLPYEEAEELVRTLCALPGVADLHAGTFGEASLLYPGKRVRGLRLREGNRVEVHLVADLSATSNLHNLAESVRRTVTTSTGLPTDVVIADVTETSPA